jgi:hypothetical protein
VLSRPDGERHNDGLITFKKLEAVCKDYEVFICCEFSFLGSETLVLYNYLSVQCPSYLLINMDLQVLLSPDDLKLMVRDAANNSNASQSPGTVDLQTFINIIENSSW